MKKILLTLSVLSLCLCGSSSHYGSDTFLYHSDGTSSMKIGDNFYSHSDGSSSQKIGDNYYHSDCETNKLGW